LNYGNVHIESILLAHFVESRFLNSLKREGFLLNFSPITFGILLMQILPSKGVIPSISKIQLFCIFEAKIKIVFAASFLIDFYFEPI